MMADPNTPATPDPPTQTTTATVTAVTTGETWSQFVRSDKGILLWLYLFLVTLVVHTSHDNMDKELIPFLREGATGAFSGLMVALRGNKGVTQL